MIVRSEMSAVNPIIVPSSNHNDGDFMGESVKENKGLNEVEQHILDAISQIKYGAVQVLIHDSRIVQVEKSEKLRFDGNKQA